MRHVKESELEVASRPRVTSPIRDYGRSTATGFHCASNRSDNGSSLVLALVFLIAVSLIVTTLMFSVQNNLNNATRFSTVQSVQSSAGSATELAIQNLKASFEGQTLFASPPAGCLNSAGLTQIALNNHTFNVWCSTMWNPNGSDSLWPAFGADKPGSDTRMVTIVTCLSSVSSAAACASSPLLQATVSFDDYPSGFGTPVYLPCDDVNAASVLTCGSGTIVDSWTFYPVVPVVTSISGAVSASTTSTLTVTGSNLGGLTTGNATVDFINVKAIGSLANAEALIATASPIVTAAVSASFPSPASCVASCSISAQTPLLTSGETYAVVVVGPGGTSAIGPTFVAGP